MWKEGVSQRQNQALLGLLMSDHQLSQPGVRPWEEHPAVSTLGNQDMEPENQLAKSHPHELVASCASVSLCAAPATVFQNGRECMWDCVIPFSLGASGEPHAE